MQKVALLWWARREGGNALLVNAATFAWSAAFLLRASIRRPAVASPDPVAATADVVPAADAWTGAGTGDDTSRGAFAVVMHDRQLRRLLGLAMALNMAV